MISNFIGQNKIKIGSSYNDNLQQSVRTWHNFSLINKKKLHITPEDDRADELPQL